MNGFGVEKIEMALDGTPYSFTDDCDATRQFERLWSEQRSLSRRLTVVIHKLAASGLRQEIDSQTQAREIFESNKLEGVGPGFPQTVGILQSKIAHEAVESVRAGMLLTTLTGDSKVLEVIGMRGAKELARSIASDSVSDKPFTEVDLRSIHSLVSSGELFAGSYRTQLVAIAQARHKPPHPIDVPRLMGELISWVNESQESTPVVVRAAVFHAWLTHIHPFEDGNGRTARILVNLLMTRFGLPPVILRHGADRATYLDALAQSDEAGDILPFAGVLLGTLKRHIGQVEKPRFIRQVFYNELRQRGNSLYDVWRTTLLSFVDTLVHDLAAYRLKVEKVGDIDRTSFELLRESDSTGNLWLLRIFDDSQQELLIWVGYSSWETAAVIPGRKKYPALYFSVRNYGERLSPYRRTTRNELGGLHEVVIIPGAPPQIFAMFDRLKQGAISDSAEEIAMVVAKAFSQEELPNRESWRSTE